MDHPSEILFVTDLLAEAEAAKLANLRVALSVRPGNAALPDVSSFALSCTAVLVLVLVLVLVRVEVGLGLVLALWVLVSVCWCF